MDSCLSALAASGVLERTGNRHGSGSYLRVSPRFLAHAEGTGGRLRLQGRPNHPTAVLQVALSTWDEYHHDAWAGALALAGILESRDQWGALRPVFPSLDAYTAAA